MKSNLKKVVKQLMDILISGSVAYDYLMTFPGLFKEQILPERLASISLSFLVDTMTRQRGGIAPNIAYTLALLGEHPRLFATVGEDFEDYRAWLGKIGVDTEYAKVIPGKFTASFFATTDQANAQIAIFLSGRDGGCSDDVTQGGQKRALTWSSFPQPIPPR